MYHIKWILHEPAIHLPSFLNSYNILWQVRFMNFSPISTYVWSSITTVPKPSLQSELNVTDQMSQKHLWKY